MKFNHEKAHEDLREKLKKWPEWRRQQVQIEILNKHKKEKVGRIGSLDVYVSDILPSDSMALVSDNYSVVSKIKNE